MSGTARDCWALVPVKRFDRAKRRLSAILDGQERARLAEAMLVDVLDALAAVPDLCGIVVVTNDERAAAIAAEHRACVVNDPAQGGTNPAVLRGLEHIRSGCPARTVMIVPADVPLIGPDDIRAALKLARQADVVISPAARDGGTNLLLGPASSLAPAFGRDSFAGHLRAVEAAGLTRRILRRDTIGLDIDDPRDLALAIARGADCRGRRFLAGLETERLSSRQARSAWGRTSSLQSPTQKAFT